MSSDQEKVEYVETFLASHLARFGVNSDDGEALDWLEADVTVDDAMEWINRGCGPGDASNWSSFAEAFPENPERVLGECVHGVDLDHQFCQHGCRV